MPDNEIGKATIRVEGDTTDLNASIETAKGTVEGLGDSAESAGGRIKKSFGSVSGTVKSIGDGASRIQETFSKLVIPVLFITGIAALADKVFKLRTDAEGYRDALKSSGEQLKQQNISEIRDDRLTALQREIASISDASTAAENATRKVFEDTQTSIKILTRTLNEEIKAGFGVDLFGVEGTEEQFDSLNQAIKRIRNNQDELVARAIRNARDEVSAVESSFEEASERFAQSIAQQQAIAMREAGDFLGASRLELEIATTAAARERETLLRQIKDATKELGDEFDEVGKRMLSNFDAMSAAQLKAIERQAEVLQRQFFQPFIDSINNAFDTGFTTRLDGILNELQEQTDRMSRG